jgi:hypothetical protein
VVAIPRIRNEELFALAAFAPPFGVHTAHPSAHRTRRQGKKIQSAQEDLSLLNGEVDRPEVDLGFHTAGSIRVSSRR